MQNDEWVIDLDAWALDFPDPVEGDHNGGKDVREPPPGLPRRDELPGSEDDVDPEDGGGRVEKHSTCR
jgi:hypothetical protein